jgi:hypothetical protein
MPRPVRIEYPRAIYHVMNRGDRRQDIFRNVHVGVSLKESASDRLCKCRVQVLTVDTAGDSGHGWEGASRQLAISELRR